MMPCDQCSSFDFSCTGSCQKPFGVRLHITRIKFPAWVSDGHKMTLRRSLDRDDPESIENWIRKNLGIEPEEWMWS